MENIYGQTEMERNSIVKLPEGYAEKAGNTLYSWLGSLWRGLHEGYRMIRGIQSARGIRLAQLYLDILEASMLKDRFGAPVFHRELWHPIVVRRSQRNRSQENLLKIGIDGDIGPQPAGSEYGDGKVFKVGKMADYDKFVTYPVDADIAGGAMSIADNIVNPSVFMERGDGKDFEIRNNSIIFPVENDPLGDSGKFEKYDVPSEDGNPEKMDVEAVLWASDVLIDKNYVADHISYALGATTPSSDVVKRILNAAWSSVTSGLTPELLRTLIAAMLNIPVVQGETETVVDISVDEENGSTVVTTDSGIYKVSRKARLAEYVKIGSVLKRGEFIDDSVRIYAYMNACDCFAEGSLGSSSSSSDSGEEACLGRIEKDIPSVVLHPGMIKAKTEFGIYAMWGKSDVKKSNDGNDNHLYFDIGGTKEDVDSFWRNVWKSSDESGVKMESVIGKEGELVSPAMFFIKNLVGANTIFVVIDNSKIDDDSMMRDPMFFDMLSDVVPSSIRLFLVEHDAVGGDDKAYLGNSGEEESVFASIPKVTDEVFGGLPCGKRRSSFCEFLTVRFVRTPPAKTRGAKEEEK